MNEVHSNDLESLLFVEDMFEESGRLDGIQHGQRQAWQDGFLLGLKQGFKLAKEIGYYQGFATYHSRKLDEGSETSLR
ncbi:hypothetical protein HDV03_002027 [Kappamyces sp. JEL0829]|nr:hypothetical protein HDV03_002027 [Kappamyces sp. JEL0829]